MQRFGTTTGSTRRRYGKTVASVRYLPNGLMLQLEVPFNKEFTETLKKSLSSKKRMWDNNDKCWYIVRDQFDKLCHILEQYFDETILLDFPPMEVSDNSWGRLYLVKGAPLEVVRAVYKALALKHHPDKGGDVGVMQSINAAYKEILGDLKNGG